jgi:hypothetical protein
MSARVLISDHAKDLLEKEQERRIKARWKRRCSLGEIASEAILMFAGLGSGLDAVNDSDSTTKEATF